MVNPSPHKTAREAVEQSARDLSSDLERVLALDIPNGPALRAQQCIESGYHGARTPGASQANKRFAADKLRLISYNIQNAFGAARLRHYVTHSWKHVLPHTSQHSNLRRVADTLADFDVIGLQEVDAGSYRTGYVNQTEFLAQAAGFDHWYTQINRRFGKIAQQSLGVVSRGNLKQIEEFHLPGRIPGRGALMFEVATANASVTVVVVHLALGPYARQGQIEFLIHALQDRVARGENLVVLGDFNCGASSADIARMCHRCDLQPAFTGASTFPSWRPVRQLDHILVSERIAVNDAAVLDNICSDHLPVAVELKIDSVQVTAPNAVAQRHAGAQLR